MVTGCYRCNYSRSDWAACRVQAVRSNSEPWTSACSLGSGLWLDSRDIRSYNRRRSICSITVASSGSSSWLGHSAPSLDTRGIIHRRVAWSLRSDDYGGPDRATLMATGAPPSRPCSPRTHSVLSTRYRLYRSCSGSVRSRTGRAVGGTTGPQLQSGARRSLRRSSAGVDQL